MSLMAFLLFEITKFLLLIVPVLISVAYLTLAESKVLGYTQTSSGPNVVGVYGLLQPLADGLKLFSKEMMMPNHVNLFLYFFAPILALTLSILIWSILPLGSSYVLSDVSLGMLVVFALSSVGVYAMLMSGWSSNSKYAFMGALRAAAQMISYEVSIGLMLISVILSSSSLNLLTIVHAQHQGVWFMFPLFPAAIMFLVSCFAETNSAPFDLTEGESELVSGYNVEYSSMSFALFFLAEYSHMIFMSFIFSTLFLGGTSIWHYNYSWLLFLKANLIMFLFMWVSTSFPSLSYDQLMALLWKTYLPLSLSFVVLVNTLLYMTNAHSIPWYT